MTIQINSNYLEKYANDYAAVVCEKVFSSRQFITGQDIIHLTDSIQVNFFVVKRIFEIWQGELEKLKSSPYFDYRDVAVHEALTQFMNVLSRRIKVEKSNLEPLVAQAVSEAIKLAVDPVSFYQNEIQKAPQGMINEFLSEHKKYFKWHLPVISFLIDKTGFGHDQNAYLKAVATNYHVIKDSLVSKNLLLATLGEINAFDLDSYMIEVEIEKPKAEVQKSEPEPEEERGDSFTDKIEEKSDKIDEPISEISSKPIVKEEPKRASSGMLDVISLQSRFEKESYKGMKGVIGELSESLAINQRIMFSKALFEGNSDLLMHALKLIDESGSFTKAVDLINKRYVDELSWNDNPDVMDEFLLLVFRKFSA
ncbi:MAG: hypothetical protein ACI9UV_002718 [Algoriphagus sp.]|jgi:hypothetical protein